MRSAAGNKVAPTTLTQQPPSKAPGARQCTKNGCAQQHTSGESGGRALRIGHGLGALGLTVPTLKALIDFRSW
jgi:hypothetical protein